MAGLEKAGCTTFDEFCKEKKIYSAGTRLIDY
ncbi:predicted protein [Sclerotinia sclerotiorum 1980 UF-70]|uniref:Uncharacterized protein n=1 Tax=Sclerotinia sclerotiorum (strain ATCC 18683 / 1980 / Ss-1) TaxID=665079 RepID=A7ESX9_SCLS1|nr:predicted protein [Sclerotinia sclerotiorum 1980 UF-70]EDN92571.1 predicted protein [Sclerotinia sclerotiorum 1980 UF-70]